MSEKQETWRDIVEEMRRVKRLPGYWRSCDVDRIVQFYADRIEAAVKREKAEIEADALALGGIVEASRNKHGNAAAMREALKSLCDSIDCVLQTVRSDRVDVDALEVWCDSAIKRIRATLALPSRNCDVGTVTEQEDRFEKFCDDHKYVGDDGANLCSLDCPFYNGMDCGIRWSQMPYEEGGAK